MTDVVASIRDQLSVPEVLEMLEIPGPNRIPGKIVCPVHDDLKPSLWIQESRWWCFGCGQGGDVIDLVRFVTNASFPQAVQFLGGVAVDLDREPIERPERELVEFPWGHEALNDDAIAFIRQRWPHLTPQWLFANAFVRSDTYNLLIPHSDALGKVRGVKTRSLLPHRDGKRSAFDGSNFTTRLYRLWSVAASEKAVLCEGESDCWTLSKHFDLWRGTSVYALPCGANVWRDAWSEELLQHRHIYLALDHDEAGRQATERIQDRLHENGTGTFPLFFPSEHKDVTDAYLAGWRPSL